MRNIKINVFVIFLLFLGLLIGSGFILKVKKYENNIIQNYKTFQKVMISNESYEYLKNAIDKNIFYYKRNNENHQAKIIRKINNEKGVELFFRIESMKTDPVFNEIKYYLYQHYYWKEIFS
ncbi:hypothetical protein J2Z62_000616 [Mycoplasmoides fastidiosum]|uniref:DUF3139 domain-containing protein n=1 Tax=Mycoplasmoides fastidiosum TaxID=92758 RepID=A0ABU0LZP3_9BACT|nr:hypothetical protein [Mycoplasmoides fastidiosum]MDQ0514178.1 hypothetical protein [Mycoplasmoides fastidiosum]UUD37409.1 hypothetical protein NPA10_02415 [Mycoplasmoides fastidiosum]